MAYDSILDVSKILDKYAKDISKDITTDAEKVAKDGADELKNTSPKRTGKYRKGWRTKTDKLNNGGSSTIYNATAPQLTHLLERPHADRTGTRTITPKSVGHIEKVEKQCIKDYERLVENTIKNGG